ncbi:carbohydrate ABC transporter permease [Thermosediminibacter litoriperuensis]|uniref:Carbohydrate ABC transporter membrane protein 2 (CUT1 family) n=1 Tax=Thermosediminibacter litoriperuensis TaxID=291989 RepID=A0A5S5AK61_9FIRM|nr:carbohydrate ABC transporter permease [Thermosediminibacter litoriperuensis]TYP51322.1 carbohydrate ABC transporter membrane protein 2 (CUT1 family) [Thermosediminibacter litoriperuensis]
MRGRDFSGKISDSLYLPVTLIAAIAMVIPVYILFKVSVSAPGEILTAHPSFLIKDFTLEHWVKVLKSGNLKAPFVKSFTVATLTTVAAVLIASPAAYVIARMPRKIKYPLVLSLFLTRMFPEVGIALPISVQFIKMNLIDTYTGLVLAHLILNLPFAAWILVGTFETIPKDLEEAAMVDGAGKIESLIKVITPLALPGIAVAAIFVWLNSWNEFTYALYLTVSQRTLPLQTYYYVVRGGWFDAATYATILTIPVMVVTFFLQRYMKGGYLSGAVKG